MLCEHADRSRIARGKLPIDLTRAHFQNAPQSEVLTRPQSRTDLLGWDELSRLVLVLDSRRDIRPVLGQPVHRIRLVDAAIERVLGRIFERFLP